MQTIRLTVSNLQITFSMQLNLSVSPEAIIMNFKIPHFLCPKNFSIWSSITMQILNRGVSEGEGGSGVHSPKGGVPMVKEIFHHKMSLLHF